MRRIAPALQYGQGRSLPWSGASIVNCFAEKSEGEAATELAVMAIPGLDLFSNISGSAVRGCHVMAGTLYAIVGSELYSVTSTGTFSALGIIGGGGPVRMVDNGAQLAICATTTGYVYSGGVLYRPAGLPIVSDVAYIDGYFVWSVYGSSQCVYSGINDGLNYDALDVFTAEGDPDNIVGLVNDHRELQIYGAQTIEIFYNSGGSDNVFERQGNAFIERGCFDRDSITKIDNSVHFLGDDRIVYRLDGYTPIRISTHPIEYRIREATYARAFTYTQEGHKFYVLTTDVGTFAYDMATSIWHERRSFGLSNYRVGGAVQAWNRTIMWDGYTGTLYTPSLDTYTENGDIISVEIALPTLGDGTRRLTMYAFQVQCETGVGLATGQGSNPQIMARYSKDGGRTYSNEIWRSMGAIGTYLTRAIWRSWGQFWQLDVSLTITDPVRRFVMSYSADVR